MQGLSQTIQLRLNLTFLVFKVDLTCGGGFALAPTASCDAVAGGGLDGFGCLGAEDDFSFYTPLILLYLSAASICSPINLITSSMSIVLLFADFAHSSCSMEGINLINIATRSPPKELVGTPNVSNALM
jgi:hypothetical protein